MINLAKKKYKPGVWYRTIRRIDGEKRHVKLMKTKDGREKIRVLFPKNRRKKDLAQIPYSEARKQKRKRYDNTHPDALQTARVTFLRPNKEWANNPERYDVLDIDTDKAPEAKKHPKQLEGLKGQVIEYKGKLYVADKQGKYSNIQKTL